MLSNRRMLYFPKVDSAVHILFQYGLNLLIVASQYVIKNIVGNVVHSQPCSHGNLFQPFVGFAGNPDDLCIL